MGACDGPRRLEPVAPAVGDRPSIGDEARPGQSHGPYSTGAPERGARHLSVTSVRQTIFPEHPTVANRDRRPSTAGRSTRTGSSPWGRRSKRDGGSGLNGRRGPTAAQGVVTPAWPTEDPGTGGGAQRVRDWLYDFFLLR